MGRKDEVEKNSEYSKESRKATAPKGGGPKILRYCPEFGCANDILSAIYTMLTLTSFFNASIDHELG